MAHRVIRALCTLALLLGAPPGLQAQEATPEFRAGAEVVVLDVVVRDEQGQTVRDLRPEEVRLFEDGVEQELVSFRLRAAGRLTEADAPASGADDPADARRAPRGPAEGAAPSDEDARHVNLVTLVFDQLGPDGRRLAREAGLALAGITDREDLLVSVFKVRESLTLVQQFTADRERVREAVIEATGASNTQYTDATEELADAVERDRIAQERLDQVGTVGSLEQGSMAAQLGQQADLTRMAVDALRLTQTLQREQQGNASLYSLLALSRQQQSLAGRKTILYFSEGLRVPTSLEHVLRQAISEANRANVSIYTVDARGLTVDPRMDATRETLRQARVALQRQASRRGIGAVSKEEVLALDTAEEALRMDVQGALTDLAHGTGGTLIADTNRVGPAIERAVGDMRGYYELVYAPTNPAYDGSFREIDVKVSRSGRAGAVPQRLLRPAPGGGHRQLRLRGGPAAVAAALSPAHRLRPARDALPLRTRAGRCTAHPGPGGAPVRAHVRGRRAGRERPCPPLVPGSAPGAHRAGGREVRRGLAGVPAPAAARRPPAGQRDLPPLLCPRPGPVHPGDGGGGPTLPTATARAARSSTSPAPTPGLVASEIALIKRREAVPSGVLDSLDPFRQGETRLVPWLAEPRLGPEDALSLFLVAYPHEGADAVALLEFVRDGHVVGQTLSELPPPDASGRSPFVAEVPTGELEAGRYEVRVLLKQGGLVAHRKAHFVLNRTSS